MTAEPRHDVDKLIRHYADVSDELEVLVLLRRSDHPWTATELGAVLSRPAATVADDLQALFKRGLVSGTGGWYRYAPDDPTVDTVIERVIEGHRRAGRCPR